MQDPDGVEWEVYHLNYDLEGDADAAAARTSGLSMVASASCCSGSGGS